jgi:predicted ATPase/DNA-binding NarL/FixJ family response regulator
VGKTRLALEVAADQVVHHADGVWLVELAAFVDSDAVIRHLAAILGVQQRTGSDISLDIVDWLQDKHLLLVLDNCEHVLETCAQLATSIVSLCPGVTILATSREVLGIASEAVWRVDPLGVPEPALTSAQSALESEAVRLFMERAVAAAPGFTLIDQNAQGVAHICRRLDGLPLALELAAARLRAMSVDDIAQRLDRRFELVSGGDRTAASRHRTLRALVDWSYDLLDADECDLFEQLSVFSGGWTLDAAEAVCTLRHGPTLDVLAHLIDKSLVQAMPQPDGSVRYGMLETVREYAREHLGERADSVLQRYALFYATALARWWGPIWWGENTDARLARLERDYSNFQASHRWLVAHNEVAAAQNLAASLGFFWLLRARVHEGRQWLGAVLALDDVGDGGDDTGGARFAATVALGQLEMVGGNRPSALTALQSALAQQREMPTADAAIVALALGLTGWLIWMTSHDVAVAREYIEEGLKVAQDTATVSLEGYIRSRLAALSFATGDFAEAERLLEENRELSPGFQSMAGNTSLLLGRMRYAQSNFAAAAAHLEEVTTHYQGNHHPHNAMLASTVLSWTRLAQGDLHRAQAAARFALELVRQNLRRNFSPGHLGGPLEAYALIAAASADHIRALRLEAAGATLRQMDAIRRDEQEQLRLDNAMAQCRATLGEAVSAAAAAAGRTLSVDAAIAEALALKIPPVRKRNSLLTPREHDVMALAARGLTNREIAIQLVITEGTARVHVEKILGKLGLHSRAALAAWVVAHAAETCLSPEADSEVELLG